MRVTTLATVLVLSWAVTAAAAPSKKEATAFVKEVEAAVNANSKVLSGGSSEAIRKHNEWYASLNNKRQVMFVDADACAFASDSARSLWVSAQQYSRRPSQQAYQFLERRQEDHQDNMKACKRSLRTLK